MTTQFDHVGVATDDAGALAALFADLADLEVVHEEEFNGLRVVFVDTGEGYLELLEPLESGTISRYLEENGPGLHHVALETDDLVGTLETARDLGIELIDEEPRSGAWGHEIAFLDPKDTGGILVEFVEH